MSMDEVLMITSVRVTAGNRADGKELPELIAHDLGLWLPVGMVSANRGYERLGQPPVAWDRGCARRSV
jgi:hypothetical protein